MFTQLDECLPEQIYNGIIVVYWLSTADLPPHGMSFSNFLEPRAKPTERIEK